MELVTEKKSFFKYKIEIQNARFFCSTILMGEKERLSKRERERERERETEKKSQWL